MWSCRDQVYDGGRVRLRPRLADLADHQVCFTGGKSREDKTNWILGPGTASSHKVYGQGSLTITGLEDGTLPVVLVLVLGNLLPGSQQPKLPATF